MIFKFGNLNISFQSVSYKGVFEGRIFLKDELDIDINENQFIDLSDLSNKDTSTANNLIHPKTKQK
jgi:hypothetical protein